MGCGQILIGLNRIDDLCRGLCRLFSAQQVGRNIERLGDRPKHLFRRGAEPTFYLREVRIGDAGHRCDLAHRQLGKLSLPADDLAESQLIIRRLLCCSQLEHTVYFRTSRTAEVYAVVTSVMKSFCALTTVFTQSSCVAPATCCR